MTRGSNSSIRSAIMPASTASSIVNRSIFEKFDPKPPRKKLFTHYENWAHTYDWDMLDMGYRLHEVAATLLMENMDHSRSKECCVFDVGCGTGFVGAALRKREFRGILHGVDESKSMLNVANRKNAYDDLYLQYLCLEDKIDINEKLSFDGLTCIAALGVEHIHPKMLSTFVKYIKTGGVMVFSAQNHPRNDSDQLLVLAEIKKLVEEGTIRKVSSTKEFYFNRGRTSRESEKVASCQLYCYIKMPHITQMTKM